MAISAPSPPCLKGGAASGGGGIAFQSPKNQHPMRTRTTIPLRIRRYRIAIAVLFTANPSTAYAVPLPLGKGGFAPKATPPNSGMPPLPKGGGRLRRRGDSVPIPQKPTSNANTYYHPVTDPPLPHRNSSTLYCESLHRLRGPPPFRQGRLFLRTTDFPLSLRGRQGRQLMRARCGVCRSAS